MDFMKKLILSAAFAALSSPALADMPNYDVKAHCNAVANFGGSSSQMILNGCYQQEQSSYNELKPIWDRLPAAVRKHCNEVARFGSPGSYMILNGCVQQEASASKANDNFVFKR